MDEQEHDRASRPPQLRFEGRSPSLGRLIAAGVDPALAPPVTLSFPPGVEMMTDVSDATWAEERLMGRPFAAVGALVPDAFESYARVLHPAYRRVGDREEAVTWAAVASWTGRVAPSPHAVRPDHRARDRPNAQPDSRLRRAGARNKYRRPGPLT